MKGFKKLVLATAVAAAPFAQAEMTAMDDAFLGEMTGQAGVTIELDTAITIESFVYTDTDGLDGVAASEGTLTMQGIAFGGATVGGSTSSVHDARLDDFKIDIDVDADDGLVIHLGGTDSKKGLVGANPVDFGLSIDSVTTTGMNGSIAENIKIAGNLGPIDVAINNNNLDAKDLINVSAYFEVTSGSLDVDVMGMGISNLKIGQNSQPILSGKYKQEIVQALGLNAGGTTDAAIIGTANAAGLTVATATGDAATDASIVKAILGGAIDAAPGLTAVGTAAYTASIGTAVDSDNPTPTEMQAASDASDAAVAQVKIDLANGVTTADTGLYTGTNTVANAQNANNMAFVNLTIGSGSANYSNLTEGDVIVENALIVDLVDFNIDVSMDISMGETVTYDTDGVTELTRTARSLGNIAINDLNMNGTTLKIYGH